MPWTRYFLEVGMRLIWIYREKGNRKLIRKWTTEIYPRCQELFGDEDELTLSCQTLWGLMYVDMRDLEEAEKVLKANCEKFCSVWGPDSVDAARSQGNLAIVYEYIGKISVAISYASDAFHIIREKRGPDDLLTLQMQRYLITLIVDNKPDEALPLALDCVSRIEKRLGISHPRTIQSYFVLSQVYYQLRRFSDNRTLLNMIQKVFERFNVARGEKMAELYGYLGFSYAEDDEGMAEKMFAQSIAVRREMGELHDVNSLICINRIAHSYARRGEYASRRSVERSYIILRTARHATTRDR
jgi:tetratricopeptide (TPR) repeat protein